MVAHWRGWMPFWVPSWQWQASNFCHRLDRGGRKNLITHFLYNILPNPSTVASASPLNWSPLGWNRWIRCVHATGGASGVTMVRVLAGCWCGLWQFSRTIPMSHVDRSTGLEFYVPDKTDLAVNSLTAIRVLADSGGIKNSRPVGFVRRNSTKSTITTNTTINKHHHHGGAVCPSYGVGSMDPPNLRRVTSSKGVGQGRYRGV